MELSLRGTWVISAQAIGSADASPHPSFLTNSTPSHYFKISNISVFIVSLKNFIFGIRVREAFILGLLILHLYFLLRSGTLFVLSFKLPLIFVLVSHVK